MPEPIQQPNPAKSKTPRTDAEDGLNDERILALAGWVRTRFAHQLELELAAVTKERDVLARWKHEALTVELWWNKVDSYVRSMPMRKGDLGRSVSDITLELLQDRDALRQRVEELEKALKRIRDESPAVYISSAIAEVALYHAEHLSTKGGDEPCQPEHVNMAEVASASTAKSTETLNPQASNAAPESFNRTGRRQSVYYCPVCDKEVDANHGFQHNILAGYKEELRKARGLEPEPVMKPEGIAEKAREIGRAIVGTVLDTPDADDINGIDNNGVLCPTHYGWVTIEHFTNLSNVLANVKAQLSVMENTAKAESERAVKAEKERDDLSTTVTKLQEWVEARSQERDSARAACAKMRELLQEVADLDSCKEFLRSNSTQNKK